jgi:23S rRNA (guanosine2251-2'-O)-methyltransferase
MPQYIYGKNTVLSALLANRVIRIFKAPNFADVHILNEIKKRHILTKIRGNEVIDGLVGGNHQGIVAEIREYEFVDLKDLITIANQHKYPLLVIVDEIKDPHNMGAIIRNVDALGGHGIIFKKDNQVTINATVAKVASGAIERVAICEVVNLNRAIIRLKDAGYWIIASDGKAKIDYRSIDYRMPIVLVVGSENRGISRLLKENSDHIVKIPIHNQAESLNVSAATAILLAHIFNNRFPN